MGINLEQGVYTAALGLAGAGALAVWPDQTEIGYALFAAAGLLLLWGIRINGKHWWDFGKRRKYRLTDENVAGLGRVADALANGMNARPRKADLIYEEKLESQQAAIRAKAKMMHDRLATRHHGIMEPGRDAKHDSYLASMWDAEQRGEMLDEYHRWTFEPLSRRSRGEKAEDARRRSLITAGRDIAHRFVGEGQDQGFRAYLEHERAYADIRPHLSQGYLDKLNAPRTSYSNADGAKYPPLVSWFLDELDRLEKEWGLI